MKRRLILAAVAVLLATPAANAQINHTVNLRAEVLGSCTISSAPATAVSGSHSGLTVTNATLSTFVVPIDPTTHTAEIVTGEIRFPQSVCTSSSRITVTASNFEVPSLAPNGFSNRILYQTTVTWGGVEIGSTSPDASPLEDDVEANAGEIILRIETLDDDPTPLMEGDYEGTITLTLASL